MLGCGRVTRKHAGTLRALPEVECRYASRDAAKAERFNRELRGGGAYGSYEAALADPQVDAVLVATPPVSHLQLTMAALSAGKHVIVEKPPFPRAADFEQVEAAMRASGRRVLVAENYYYRPLAESLRRIISDGEIGEVRLLLINALKHQKVEGWRDEPAQTLGGALYEGGIHWVNFLAGLGLEVRAAHGFFPGAIPGSPQGLERTSVSVFEYAQGAVGTLYYSWEVRSLLRGLRLSRVWGTQGSVLFETNGLFAVVSGRRGRRVVLPGFRDISGYRAMFQDFVRALRTGTPARMELSRARRDLELVEAIYASRNSSEGTNT
jgi:predicted dehydrogenase